MRYKYLYIISCAALSLISCNDDLGISDSNIPSLDGNGPVLVNSSENAMPNMVLVKFHEEYAETVENSVNSASSRAASRSGLSEFDRFLENVQVESFERLFPKNKFEKRTRAEGMHLWYKVCFRSTLPMEEVARELKTMSSLQVVQFNEAVKPVEPTSVELVDQLMLNARSMAATSGVELPSDPEFSNQWNMYYNNEKPLFDKYEDVAHINFPAAWKIQKKASDVIVAVIDQGVNYNHPDLAGNMWVNEKELLQGDTEDRDGNGYAGDRHGYDFASGTSEITINTHGTHVAGTISAMNNNVGVAGIAGGDGTSNGARIMTCSIFTATGGGGTTAVAEAVKYACDNGAVICQNSWGYDNPSMEWEGSSYYRAERQAYDYFIKYAGYDENGKVTGPMAGGLVTFSAGNAGHQYGDAKMYPAGYPDFIAVASVGADGRPAYYTNYGDWIDICAPGGDQVFASNELQDSAKYTVEKDMHGGVLSTYFDGSPRDGKYSYAYMQGTSQACPQVSGVAALAIQHAKDKGVILTAAELRELILESTSYIEDKFTGEKSDNGGVTGATFTVHMEDYKGKMGRGLLNAGLILENVRARVEGGQSPNKPVNVTADELNETLAPGSITLKWTPGDGIDFYRVYISEQAIAIDDNGYVKPSSDVTGPIIVSAKQGAKAAEVVCELSGLRPSKKYNVVIIAVNQNRVPSEPLQVSFTTAAPAKGPAVKNFKELETGATSTTLEWTEVGDCVGDLYVSYVVTCATDPNFKQNIVTKTVLAKEVGKTMQTTVTGLKPQTTYYVKVEAWDQYNFLSAATQSLKINTGANNIPKLEPASVEAQSVQYWEKRELVFQVSDADENDTWTASLKDKAGCWTLTTDANTVKLTFNGPVSFTGTANAELTIIDSNGGEVKTNFNYTVIANVAPEPYKRFEDIYLTSWGTPCNLTLGGYFIDKNNETLNYSFTQTGKSVSVSINDGIMSVTGTQNGLTTLEVTATDAAGRSAKSSKFQVMVRQSSSTMDIYPNPVSDVMNIRMGQDVKGEISVRVLTAMGSVAYSTNSSISPFSPAQIDVSSLNSGNYIVEVTVQATGQTYKNNIVKL